MKGNSFKNQLFRSIYTHPDECFDPISEHCHPKIFGRFKMYLVSEHCHPKMKDKGLAILVFRSIAPTWYP